MLPIVDNIMTEDFFKARYSVDKIDIDLDPIIAAKWAVRGIPTFIVVDDQGKEIARHAGAMSSYKMRDWMAEPSVSRLMSTSNNWEDNDICQLPRSNWIISFIKEILLKIKNTVKNIKH